jgi:hypothetical protein
MLHTCILHILYCTACIIAVLSTYNVHVDVNMYGCSRNNTPSQYGRAAAGATGSTRFCGQQMPRRADQGCLPCVCAAINRFILLQSPLLTKPQIKGILNDLHSVQQ